MHRSTQIFLTLLATLALSACPGVSARLSNPSSAFEDNPIVVFVIDWDYSSSDNLVAWPIVVYRDGHFREPPCTADEPEVAKFIQSYLSRGRALFILRGGAVIGQVTITRTVQRQYRSCYDIVVQVDMPGEVADALDERDEVLLAVTESPPEQPEGPPQPAGESLDAAYGSIVASLLGNGVPAETAGKMKTEGWTISANRRDIVVTAYAYDEEVSAGEDLHSFFMFGRRQGNAYRPMSVEYWRTPQERKSQFCSVHFIDALNLSRRDPAWHTFVRYSCYDRVGHGVYGPDGRRVFAGSFYGS